jgi:mRNA-degrading endonuclease HigB of HigAB toxin-antitoxin module
MRRNAKDEARKIEADAHAKNGTITAAKHLLAGIAAHKIAKDYVTQFRAWWSSVTLPWFDGKGAPRAVNALAITDLKVEIGDRIRTAQELFNAFMEKYPEHRAQRQFEMGELFDPAEFPSPAEMRRKFAIRVDWYPLPDAKDIRVIEGIDEEEMKQIAADAVASEKRRIEHAMGSAAQKLFKVVKSMHETMSTKIGDPGSKFNNTKLDNILMVAELIPKINLTNDPKLAELAKLAKKLATKSPDELREDEVKREAAAKEAKSLADKLAGMFSTAADDDDGDQ